jgi:hypothetical protein
MSIRIPSLGVALALVAALPAWSQSADGVGAMYRCPGNDYNNTISAAEAEKLRCKKVENAPVTVIQSATTGASAPSAAPPARPVAAIADPMSPADSAALRAARQQRPPQPRRPAEERGRQAVGAREGIQRRRARAPHRRVRLPEVPRSRRRDAFGDQPQADRDRRAAPRDRQAADAVSGRGGAPSRAR